MDYIKTGVDIYHSNIGAATEIAGNFVAEERPFASSVIKGNIPKYAQEQMRMFISVIFPTALIFTVNNGALAAMYESAWTPAMKHITEEMARLYTEKYPETSFMFNKERRRKSDWATTIKDIPPREIKHKPSLELLNIFGEENFSPPDSDIMHPVDKLRFTPEMMENSIGDIKTKIEISVATMGQDQRHRTISRGVRNLPETFTRLPILKKLNLEKKAL